MMDNPFGVIRKSTVKMNRGEGEFGCTDDIPGGVSPKPLETRWGSGGQRDKNGHGSVSGSVER